MVACMHGVVHGGMYVLQCVCLVVYMYGGVYVDVYISLIKK